VVVVGFAPREDFVFFVGHGLRYELGRRAMTCSRSRPKSLQQSAFLECLILIQHRATLGASYSCHARRRPFILPSASIARPESEVNIKTSSIDRHTDGVCVASTEAGMWC
jgi:hypothetical protein